MSRAFDRCDVSGAAPSTAPALEDLANEDALRARLEGAICASGSGGAKHRTGSSSTILVGVIASGRSAYAAARMPRAARPRSVGASNSRLRTGCVTKLLTATLALRACRDGLLALDADVASLLPAAEPLESITLRHLLEHRHGLDDSALASVPRRADGSIAAERLVAALAGARLGAPGELYSYSNAGAWLAAAALERASGRRYDALLAGLLGRRPRKRPVCPALGGPLTVPIGRLLELATDVAPRVMEIGDEATAGCGAAQRRIAAGGRGAAAFRAFEFAAPVARLPGWSPFERGVCLGWKHYGGAWVGHNSVWPGASVVLRVEPSRRAALLVASIQEPASMWAARLFGKTLPDLSGIRMPRSDGRTDRRRRYAGVYRNAGLTARVEQDSKGGLMLETSVETSAETSAFAGAPGIACGAHRRRLRPCADHVFFPEPPGDETFPYVQFVGPCEAGFRYLWNGRFVLRNAASPFIRSPGRGDRR